MDAMEKLAAQMALKAGNDKLLDEMKAGNDADVLQNWRVLGYPQPAPVKIQEIKNKTGLSWAKLKKFIETL